MPRQFSVWPFGTRNLRLLLLIDPSRVDADLIGRLLRAMHHTAFRSETGSQTAAVRSAVLAAHYVLQHYNHDALPHEQVTAAVAVAIRRDNVGYVAMAGDAVALAWQSGRLSGQRAPNRSGRPLGLDAEPGITYWSTPLRHGDRVVLMTGATWQQETDKTIFDVLAGSPADQVEERLSVALSNRDTQVRVLSDDGTALSKHATARGALQPVAKRVKQSYASRWRLLLPVLPALVLGIGAAVIMSPNAPPQQEAFRQQAEALLAQAEQARDLYQAHSLVANARVAAQRAVDLAPAQSSALLQRIASKLDEVDRAETVQPAQLVRLGPTGANIVDLAVSADRVFTLDVVEGAVRGFDPWGAEQWPTPDTLLVRKGSAVGGRSLDTPVAIQYLAGQSGGLTIVDRARMIAQLRPDGVLLARPLPSSAAWQKLGALGADVDGNLYVLDSGAQALFEYRGASQKLIDPPNPVWATPPSGLERVAEVLPLASDLFVRLDDGSVRRLSRSGQQLDFMVRPPDVALGPVTALALDRAGGLYLADPSHARIVHVAADGTFVRQFRDPALAGIRQLQSGPDGQRLYGLVASGVLAFDLPPER